MKQRDIYLADLNPIRGSEQAGIRPVVVVSGNTMNENLEVCIVCPLTAQIKNYAGCVPLKKNKTNNLPQSSEIITFQMRTVAKSRLLKKIGHISPQQLEAVFAGLSDVLRY